MEAKENNPSIKEGLINDILGIIDTKIQYIEYQTELVTSSFVDVSLLSRQKNRPFGNGFPVEASIMANNQRILFKLSEFSATIKLLLLLRNKLTAANAAIVFDLLTDNRFTQLTDQELKQVIDPCKNRL